MDDYLERGGVRSNLEILSRPQLPTAHPARKEELFLQGYGRQWGEKLTYSVGLSYGTGILVGGGYGLLVGLRRGGATRKLFLNSVLNSCSTYGPGLANQGAVITMFYCGFNNLIQFATGSDEVYNSAVAGALAGGLFKSGAGWRIAGTYSAAAAGLFSAVDFGFRHGYI